MSGTTLEQIFANETAQERAIEDAGSRTRRSSALSKYILQRLRSQSQTPYGIPAQGRPGFVLSPYSPTGGYIDVRGLPHGTAVRDPFSRRVFLVP